MELIRLIKHKCPQVKIVMLATYPDPGGTAIDAGVDTFLLKGCQAETLFDAILD